MVGSNTLFFISIHLILSSLQFHKRQEKDLLDQKKEKEEALLLEMVSDVFTLPEPPLDCSHHLCYQEHLERQQTDEKMSSKKVSDRKRELKSPLFSFLCL